MQYSAEQLQAALQAAQQSGDAEAVQILTGALQQALQAAQGQPGAEEPSYAQGLAQQAGQGLTMGFLDEAIGILIPKAVEFFEPDLPKVPNGPEWMTEVQRQQAAAFQAENPVASTVAKVGGAMLAGGGAAGAAKAVAPGAVGAVTASTPAWMLSTGAGATAGGLTAAGEAAEGSRLSSGAGGAVVGALGGAAAHALFKRIGPAAWGWLKNKLTTAPKTEVQRVLRSSLREAGLDPAEADSFVRALGPDGILADVPGLRGTAVATSSLPGAPRELIQRTLGSRDAKQQADLWSLVAQRIQVSGKVRPSMNALAKAQKDAAKQNYDAAYNHTISRTPVLRQLMDDPLIVDAIKHAKKLSRGRGMATLALKNGKLKEFPNMEGWDWIQRGLRSRAQGAAASGKKDIARTYEQARRELTGELDAINPDFKKARHTYARYEAVKDAVETGRKALREDTEVLEELLEDYTHSERQGFMLGLGKALREEILRPGQNRDVTRIPLFQSPLVAERLKAALGEDTAEAIGKEARRLATMRSTNNAVMSRSTTADILSARAALGQNEGAPMMQSLIEGASPTEAVRRAIRSLSDTHPAPETVELLGRSLFTPGVSAQRMLSPGPAGRASSALGGPTGFLGQQSPVGVGAGLGGLFDESFLR